MHNRAILLESNRLEAQLINFQIEGALLEVMKNDFMARAIIAEHRKIEKYALQLGLIDKHKLNEGLAADVVLGAGQMLGSIGSYFGFPLGMVFGAAGVIWYGKEMLAAAPGSFDFFMNLIFALFSAAACEPTGAAATATNISKLFTPFIRLGAAAKALGSGVLNAGKALAFVKQGGTAVTVGVNAAAAAQPAIVGAFPILDNIVAGATGLLQRVAPQIEKIPGAGIFRTISETIAKWGAKAWTYIKGCLEALFAVARTAAGKAGAKVAANAKIAAKETAVTAMEVLMKKMPLQTANRILLTLGEKQFSIAGKKCFMDAFVPGRGFSIKFVDAARPQLITAPSLPSFISSVLQTFGKDAAAAIIVKAQTAYPASAVKLGLEALRPYLGSAPNVAAAV
jgi:hypothetical protein